MASTSTATRDPLTPLSINRQLLRANDPIDLDQFKIYDGTVFVDMEFLEENKRRKIGMEMNFPTSIFHLVCCVLTYFNHKPEEYTIKEVHLYNEEKNVFEKTNMDLSDIPMYPCLRCKIQVKKSKNNTAAQMLQEFTRSGRSFVENFTLKRSTRKANPPQNVCRICMNNNSDAVILPCAHAGICFECGKRIKANANETCPICRGRVEDVKKLYYA